MLQLFHLGLLLVICRIGSLEMFIGALDEEI